MKSLYVSFLFFLVSFVSFICGQLLDLCSNNVLLHESEHECLKIVGCCYATLELKADSEITSHDIYRVSNCFKRHKEDFDETCLNYQKVSLKYGNSVVSCKCNYENY